MKKDIRKKLNKYKKIIFIIQLVIFSNTLYASNFSEKIGIINITESKIVYKHNEEGSKEIKISDSNVRILRNIFSDIQYYNHNLEYTNFVNGTKIIVENNKLEISGNILLTGNGTMFLIKDKGFFRMLNGKFYDSFFFMSGVNTVIKTQEGDALFKNLGDVNLFSKFVIFYDNRIYSRNQIFLLYLTGMVSDFGSRGSDLLFIDNNKIVGDDATLIKVNNHFVTTFNRIFITNNETITLTEIYNYTRKVTNLSTIFLDGGVFHIKLVGFNPHFELSNNKIMNYFSNVIGILMSNESEIIFENYSDHIALIKLGQDIKSYESNNTKITFKNNDKRYLNGSFRLELGKNLIEAGEINIQSNVTIFLTLCNKDFFGTLIGINETDSSLNINNDSKLFMEIDESNLECIDTNRNYTIISKLNFDDSKIEIKNDIVRIKDKLFNIIRRKAENNLIISFLTQEDSTNTDEFYEDEEFVSIFNK